MSGGLPGDDDEGRPGALLVSWLEVCQSECLNPRRWEAREDTG